jgi:hypothetical protein
VSFNKKGGIMTKMVSGYLALLSLILIYETAALIIATLTLAAFASGYAGYHFVLKGRDDILGVVKVFLSLSAGIEQDLTITNRDALIISMEILALPGFLGVLRILMV